MRALVGGVPPRLCAGTEPGRIHLGLLEAACSAQCLPEGLLEPGRDSKANTEENAATAPAHYCLLAAGQIVFLMSLYYAKTNSIPPRPSPLGSLRRIAQPRRCEHPGLGPETTRRLPE